MRKSGAPLNPDEPLILPDEGGPVAELDLPDAPDFVSRRSRVSLERMLPLLEQYRQWLPQKQAQREQRIKRKCTVEFVLLD
jgi:hypothetical protein